MPRTPTTLRIHAAGAARALALASGLALAGLATSSAIAGVQWRSVGPEGDTRMTRDAMRDTLTNTRAAIVGDAGAPRPRLVVQFSAPITNAQKATLAGAGLRLMTYLADNAFFAGLSPEANVGAILADGRLESVREVDPRWKLHQMLLAGATPDWAVVGDANAADPKLPTDPIFGAHLYLHEDADPATEGVAIAATLNARLVGVDALTRSLLLEIPKSRVRDAVAHHAVMCLEPALFPLEDLNASNRIRTQANDVQAAPYSLNGAGVNVMVYDGGGARPTHQDFGGRVTIRDGSSSSTHATHVSGTIGGAGTASAGQHRGMAPSVTINSYSASTAGSGWLYSNPLDFATDYGSAITQFGCVLSNNSIGTNVAANGFPCDWYGNYHNVDIAIDNAVRGNLGAPIVIHWAAGNERSQSRCANVPGGSFGGGYHSLGPPSGNKNSIVVGAINSNDDSMTTFSSWGPVDDGRMKPDIVGPGCQSGADAAGADDDIRSTSNATSNVGYTNLCGTSMSTPTVTGLSALLMQDFRNNNPGSPDPLPSTFKVWHAHTAVDLFNPGPDYRSGYGSVRVKNAVDFERTGNTREGVVTGTDDTVTFTVLVQAGDPFFKATLAWDDAPGAPLVAPNLVNDLDLAVFDPNDNRAYPWTLDPANPANNAVRTVENRVDNIEQVYVATPTPGVWRVEVRGFNVPTGPQKFSLVASPSFITTTPGCPGDTNGDNIVNFADLNAVISNFGIASGATLAQGDVDGDGDVDFADLNLVISNFGTVC